MRASEQRTRNVSRAYRTFRSDVDDREVLHVGCVAHDATKRTGDEDWLHELLDGAASDLVGVDILEEEVERLLSDGYDVVCADATDMDLDRNFDVIVAGELIEHLTNFDGFFRSIDKHLEPGGKLILTTPNAMAVHWTGLRSIGADFVNAEHTCWFDSTTLTQLLRRYGFEPERVHYTGDCEFEPSDPLYTIGWAAERLLPDRIGKSTLIVVAKRKSD